ncbi:prenyl cysteine carboxyl methyltransferase-like protein Ste14 [Phyllosticta capitalensis]|uniref:Protein-S-isoprenylcysteine O-methyltransferase n=1 Tax=Phyllosticta capitalensis TaxID=121624 RepID=A0ABR1YU62_9PEZI
MADDSNHHGPNGNGVSSSNGDTPISWPVIWPSNPGEYTQELDMKMRQREQATLQANQDLRATFAVEAKELLPGQPRSLAGIGTRAFFIGQTLGLSFAGALYLGLVKQDPVWRAPFFLGVLCIFHFLEFWVTARYNTASVKTASFLLTNGKEYQIAHTAACIEHLVTRYYFPNFQYKVELGGVRLVLGVFLVLLGQVVRTIAMAQAGTNFNHMVQSKKNAGHQLVRSGVYAWLRHPSYFGFFWWGLGTQLLLGNSVCLVAYALVLWKFFNSRIHHEETYLINVIFKDEYQDYRSKTSIGIPFIHDPKERVVAKPIKLNKQ